MDYIGVKRRMGKVFEDEFMDIQVQMIALCLEFVGNEADKIYVYGSIEENSISFNAFFEIQGELKTTNKIVSDTDAVWEFLDLGESDLEKCRKSANVMKNRFRRRLNWFTTVTAENLIRNINMNQYVLQKQG